MFIKSDVSEIGAILGKQNFFGADHISPANYKNGPGVIH